ISSISESSDGNT
ncbi:Chemokine binding protein, partial [Monkeypox virus]